MMNKKADVGGETIIWIYRFVLLGFVIIAVIMIVFNFYSVKYDVRQGEALFIGKRMVNCVSEEGVIDFDGFSEGEIKKCSGFSGENQEVFASIVLSDFNDAKIKEARIGSSKLEPLCEYDVSCSRQNYYFLIKDSNGTKKAKLSLFIAIGKIEKNV